MKSKNCVSFGALLLLAVSVVHAQRRLQPLPVEELLEQRSVTEVSLAPDGGLVAYGLITSVRPRTTRTEYTPFTDTGVVRDHALGARLAVTDVGTGTSIALGVSDASTWGASWSPEGQRLAFYSDEDGYARLWVWDRRTQRARRVSPVRIRTFFNYEVPRWTPDGARLLVKVLPDSAVEPALPAAKEATPAGRATVRVLRSGPPTEANSALALASAASDTAIIPRGPSDLWALGDLAAIDVRTGTVTQLSCGGFVMQWWVSPDGRRVAYTRLLGDRPHSQQRVAEVVVVGLDDGERRVVASQVPMMSGTVVAWSPSGKLLAYATAGPDARDAVWVVSPKGNSVRSVSPGVPAPSADMLGSHQMRWTGSDDKLVYLDTKTGVLWEVDVPRAAATRVLVGDRLRFDAIVATLPGSVVLMQSSHTGARANGLYLVNLMTGRIESLPGSARPLSFVHASVRGDRLAFVSSDTTHPPGLWVGATRDFQRATQVTELNLNPALRRYVFGESRLVSWTSTTGQLLKGVLVLPAGYVPGRRYPLITHVYGGAMPGSTYSSDGGVNLDFQMLATRGYAVLYPDAPVRQGRQAEDLLAGVLPGIDEVIRLGVADSARLGVWGHSYGGYSTAVLIAGSQRFKAAVAGAGQANLLSGYFTNPAWYESGQGGMGGMPWEVFERYVANSPIFQFDRVQTPLLIYAGQFDRRGSDEMFTALKRLGKTAEYALYKGEDHLIQSPENLTDWWARVIGWFDSYLKPETAGSR